MNRNDFLLGNVSKTDAIIEIGPSFAPLAPRSAGWNSWSVDHASREELRLKYEGHRIDIENIEEVDSVWNRGSLLDAIPAHKHGSFDLLIASHVIEHLPDLVSFLTSADKLLGENGRITLAIPDKRFCFDYFKPLTMTGDILNAHARGHVRHSALTAFNHLAYSVTSHGNIGWGQIMPADFKFVHSLADAHGEISNQHETDPNATYVDYHAWYFTPSSFELIILELARLKIFDWSVENIHPTVGCEFIVRLARGGQLFPDLNTFSEARLRLMFQMIEESGVQLDYLRGKKAAEASEHNFLSRIRQALKLNKP